MGRTNRSNRRQRRQRQNQPYEPIGKVEYPGVMGWMQRNGRLLLIFGIVLMVASIGAGAIAAVNPPEPDIATPEPTTTAEATAEGTGTAEATPTGEPIVRQYSAAPEMTIDPQQSYSAIIEVEGLGEVTIELLPEEAPVYVNNFVFLARNRFYDGLTFHRVEPGFVAQAGDPTGTSTGGAGYTLPAEENDLTFQPGSLAMASSSLGVSGSQFFVTLGETPHLNEGFTVFGRVVDGMDVLEQLTPRDPRVAGTARGNVIERIEIVED